jgi:hypothetical protein
MSATETTTAVEYLQPPCSAPQIAGHDDAAERGQTDIALSQLYPSRSHNHNHGSLSRAEPVTQELKPVDRGRDAWCTLLGAFAFDALFWGMSFHHHPFSAL